MNYRGSFSNSKPVNPVVGDYFIDTASFKNFIFDGTQWLSYDPVPPQQYDFKKPTVDQLEKFPALKDAWEHFLSIKKMVGV